MEGIMFNRVEHCKIIAKSQMLNTGSFEKKVLDATGGEYEVLGEYLGNKVKILMRHASSDCATKGGHQWETRPNDFQQGKRCPTCAMRSRKEAVVESRRLDADSVRKKLLDTGGEFELIGDYVNNKAKTIFLHVKCRREFEGRLNDFDTQTRRREHFCRLCSAEDLRSKGEKEVAAILNRMGVTYNEQQTFPGYTGRKRFDFCVFHGDGSEYFLLEFDGQQHFFQNTGSIWDHKKTKRRDLREGCLRKAVRYTTVQDCVQRGC